MRSHTRTVAVVPIKLNNQRLPNKNIKPFTNGKPLCHYLLSTLLQVSGIDEVYVYCSSPKITADAITRGLDAVSGEYDSSFAAKRLQDFLWLNGKPFNYDLNDIPRTQDLPALMKEAAA